MAACVVYLLGVCGVVAFIARANAVYNTQKQKQTTPRQMCNMSCTQNNKSTPTTARRIHMLAVCPARVACCVRGLFVVFKNTLIRAIVLLFVVTTSMFIALLALYFVCHERID